MNKDKVKMLSDMISSYNNQYFSVDWIIKMLGLERNEVRKYKINKLFNDEARKI
jgi:hypothetical protein